MASNRKKAAAVIATVTVFTAGWEGTDLVAKRDPIGTGHPLTWCHGQTPADDKTVKPGQRFTPAQCDEQLAKSLPKYLAPLQECIKTDLPDKVMGAALDAAYNAGSAAVCKSPMVAHFNEGDVKAGCNAFAGWYVRASGRTVQGLVNRRNAEKQFCLAGLSEPKTVPPASQPEQPTSWWSSLLSKLKGLPIWH